MRARLLNLAPILGLVALLPACPPPCAPGEQCVNDDVKCEPMFKYDARALEAEVKAGKFGGNVDTRVEQVREVDNGVERTNARYLSLCNDYRNGAISQEQYSRESEAMRKDATRLEELWMRLESASSQDDFDRTMNEFRDELTLSGSNADMQLDVAIYAKLPDDGDFKVSAQGATLSTGTKVYLNVQSTANAYLYLYQVDPSGKLTVLFPDSQIPITNPLPAGQGVRIPHGSYTYNVNEKDLGIENLHIVA